jgi:S-adenosylmethionine hydrolase
MVRTYADVAPGSPLALVGSNGLIEIAVREGSAAAELTLARGDQILTRHAFDTVRARA